MRSLVSTLIHKALFQSYRTLEWRVVIHSIQTHNNRLTKTKTLVSCISCYPLSFTNQLLSCIILWPSLPFHLLQSSRILQIKMARWFVMLLIGMSTAVVATIIDIAISSLSDWKYGLVGECILIIMQLADWGERG